jgi:hypothetical protein
MAPKLLVRLRLVVGVIDVRSEPIGYFSPSEPGLQGLNVSELEEPGYYYGWIKFDPGRCLAEKNSEFLQALPTLDGLAGNSQEFRNL